MDHLAIFIQAPILRFPLPSSHSSLLQFFPALTLCCRGNRPKSETPTSRCTINFALSVSPDTRLNHRLGSSSKESLALLLPKTAMPPLTGIAPLISITPKTQWVYMAFSDTLQLMSCLRLLFPSPIRKLHVALH